MHRQAVAASDSLEDISYIDMEDDEMEEVFFFLFDRELLEWFVYSIFENYGMVRLG